MSFFPLCPGGLCKLKSTCAHYSEVIGKDDMAFTHPPFSKYKNGSCEFYAGLDVSALRDHISEILNGHDNKKE